MLKQLILKDYKKDKKIAYIYLTHTIKFFRTKNIYNKKSICYNQASEKIREVKTLNQILDVDDNRGKKEKVKKSKAPKMPRSSGPVEIQSIVKFFAIAILIFGIGIIGTGSYSMYKDATQEVAKTKPVIYVEQTGEKDILLKVTHDKELASITYDWNEEGATEVPTNNQKEVEVSITIPTGTNTLKVHASDINGQEIEYEKV